VDPMTYYRLIWSSIVDSSLYEKEDPMTRLVYLSMIAVSDPNGVVPIPLVSLGRRFNLPQEAVERAIEALCGPDPDDSSGTGAGERLQQLPKGFKIINFETYQQVYKHEKRKAQRRESFHRNKPDRTTGGPVGQGWTAGQQDKDQDQDQDQDSDRIPSGSSQGRKRPRKAKGYTSEFEVFWSAWPSQSRVGKFKAAERFGELSAEEQALALEAVAAQAVGQLDPETPRDRESGRSRLPHPATWLYQRRFEDEVTKSGPEGGNRQSRDRFENIDYGPEVL